MEKRRINVRGIIWHNNKLLAVKHKKEDGSIADYWAIPGGGLDPHEALTDGVIRELTEELGIIATVGKLLFVQQFASKRRDHTEELEFFFHITNPTDFTAVDLTATTHGVEEIAQIAFIDPTKEDIRPRFLATINITDALSETKPVHLYSEL